MFFKIAKPRKFEYNYRFYKQENDKTKRIEFKSFRSSRYTQKGSLLRIVFLLIFLVYLFFVFKKSAIDTQNATAPNSDKIKVEEIIVVD
ncbi:MAG: hypothetical protein GXO75_10595 [Calditrichaeota bacterium]|nr:hypothetical protein [Calditrichota bacterium]